jgi:hypothetical protein
VRHQQSDVGISAQGVREQHSRQAYTGVVGTPDPLGEDHVARSLHPDRGLGRVQEDEHAAVVGERERVCGLGRVEVLAVDPRGEAQPRKAGVERALGLGQPGTTPKRVHARQGGEAARVARDELGQEVVLAPRLFELLVRALRLGERVGEHGLLEPSLLLALQVAVDVEQVPHEGGSLRILAGEVGVEVDRHRGRYS